MARMLAPLPRHRTLSVMPTYQCTAKCEHCGTYSSPKEPTRLDPELMLSGISQAIDLDYKVVVFTGGEPTLEWNTLLRGIRLASSRGVPTRIVTNGCWATDEATADAKLAELLEAGLAEINLSTGDQHVRFVPIENVLRAVRAAAKIPMRTIVIMVEMVNGRSVTAATLLEHPEWRRIRSDYPDAVLRITESPWMPLSAKTTNQYGPGMTVSPENLPMRTGCNSCLTTTTLQADGRIGACCGLGMRSIKELQLGNLRDTSIAEADERGGNDFLKRWIRVEGPDKILAWAAGHDPSIKWEGLYAHRCQSCIRLYRDEKVRRVIRDHHQEMIGDVLMREFLLNHFDPMRDGADYAPEAGAGAGVQPEAKDLVAGQQRALQD
jgi:pyruvate-formate lyase-activating enzyme